LIQALTSREDFAQGVVSYPTPRAKDGNATVTETLPSFLSEEIMIPNESSSSSSSSTSTSTSTNTTGQKRCLDGNFRQGDTISDDVSSCEMEVVTVETAETVETASDLTIELSATPKAEADVNSAETTSYRPTVQPIPQGFGFIRSARRGMALLVGPMCCENDTVALAVLMRLVAPYWREKEREVYIYAPDVAYELWGVLGKLDFELQYGKTPGSSYAIMRAEPEPAPGNLFNWELSDSFLKCFGFFSRTIG
jgi:hypothetical protein